MISILLTFLLWTSVQSQTVLTVKDLDDVSAKLLAFGDKNNTLPVDNIEAKEICDKYNELASLASNLVQSAYKQFGITDIQGFKSASLVCQLYNDFPNEMKQFAAEVNSKTDILSDSHRKLNNLFGYIAIGKAGHDFCVNFPRTACYANKWYNEVTNLLSAESKIQAKKIFQFYLDFVSTFKPAPSCEWSDVPEASNIPFASIDLNYVNAGLNCFDAYTE